MRRSQDFTDAVRGGARRGSRRLVVHLTTSPESGKSEPLVGLVVSRAIGNAVERNLVKRRLRGLLNLRMNTFAPGDKLVVRALPAARGATSVELATDLDAGLGSVRRRLAKGTR